MHRPLLTLLLLLLVFATQAIAADAAAPVDFSDDVLPILSDRCFHCHGPDASNRQAELRFDRKESVFADRGDYQILVPGSLTKSELYRRISSHDDDDRMPPPDAPRQLTLREKEVLRRWIESGAEWSQHWAFEPPVRPALQADVVPASANNAIDLFVETRLQQRQLALAERADKSRLARRAAFDLTGLPLEPAQQTRFLNDDRPDHYSRFVDRLLASPRYGENMAVPWMDAARYADTDGYQNDRLRYMSVWRDWLIDALNAGMPFDQFTIEQLAGDMLPDATLRQQIATGFCRNHRINSEGGSIPEEWAVEYVVDRADTVGTVWLGLTVGCARCHDHKYDPISQRDYYQLFAYFNHVPEWGLGPNNGNSPPFITVPKSWPHLSDGEDKRIDPLPYELKTTQTSVVRPLPGDAQTLMVMAEMAEPRATYVLQRGQYDQPDKRERLSPSLPEVLRTKQSADDAASTSAENRLTLARWLVDESNPLTSRVIANRQWQHFFGIGIVETSENFGVQGERPTHPQLLDWLATEYVRIDWDTKLLHRRVVCSATYQQDATANEALLAADPDNRWLARGPRRRLSAQAIRDQALAASGLLVERLGGPSVKPYMPPGVWRALSNNKYVQDHGANLYRRSLYTYWRRTLPPPTMMNFNAAEREVCIVRKDQTNSPLQALTMMNNVVFVESSRMIAERTMRDCGESLHDQRDYACHLILGRDPTTREASLLNKAHTDYLAQFQANPADADRLLKTGEYPADASLDKPQLAALTMIASTLLNLDEAITKP